MIGGALIAAEPSPEPSRQAAAQLPAPYERVVGRYALCGAIAQGGMATVHVGRQLGDEGFSRIVAIKSLHPQFAKSPEFLAMFLDEARLASRIRHANVVSMIDVVSKAGELFLIMDYVTGETLSRLMRAARSQGRPVPVGVALRIAVGMLEGLHAAHEARDSAGNSLGLVHRDVSPQNVLVGIDGVPRLVDFGIAKAVGRMHTTRNNELKGKLAYMAPEQLSRQQIDRRVDVYAASIVLWEMLTGQRLFQGQDEVDTFQNALMPKVRAPSELVAEVPETLDAVVLRGLAAAREDRYPTAHEMAQALEELRLASSSAEVASWVRAAAKDALAQREAVIAEVERAPVLQAALAGEETPSQQRASVSLLIDQARAEAEAVTAVPPSASENAIPAEPPTPQRKTRPWVVVAAAAAGILLAGLGVFAFTPDQPPAHQANEIEPRVEPVLPPKTTRPPRHEQEAQRPEPMPTASAPPPTAEPAHESPASTKAPRTAPRKRRQAVPKPKALDCSNPFTVDEQGVRVPRRECL